MGDEKQHLGSEACLTFSNKRSAEETVAPRIRKSCVKAGEKIRIFPWNFALMRRI